MVGGSAEPIRVLAADDDATARILVRGALESAGDRAADMPPFELTLCDGSETAIEEIRRGLAEHRPYAVAFLDVDMPPGPDGVWCAETIRALDPSVQIVMVTSHEEVSPAEIAARVAPPDKILYLQKPVHPHEIRSCATACGAKWRAELAVEAARLELEERVRDRTAELARVNAELERDIAERCRVEAALRASQENLTRAQSMARLGSWELDLGSGELRCSSEIARILEVGVDTLPTTLDTFLARVHPEERGGVQEWLERAPNHSRPTSIEHRILCPDGRQKVLRGMVEASEVGGGRTLVGAVQDVSEIRRKEEQIAFFAYHDALTGLPNRRLLNDRLRVAVARAKRKSRGLAVLFLDLDDFKTVNDSLGHPVGDLVLKATAERLQSMVRDEDTVARVGGDEFLILLSDVSDPSYPVQVAERILGSLERPFQIREHEIYVSASAGITLFPDDGNDPDTLVANADIAMYRAKDHGRNTYKLYTVAMNAHVMGRMTLELGLRKALQRDEFVLHYQPLFAIDRELPVAVEALLRWDRPEFGLEEPSSFIPLAEETGLILPIGEWVLRTACAQAAAWHAAGHRDLLLSVNLSPRQFQDPGLIGMVRSVLAQTRLDPGLLLLEVTENAVITDIDRALATMRELTAHGVHLAMDDFGSGYSALIHLKQFPVRSLKIDASFVREIEADPRGAGIVEAMISMGRSLGLDVVAEGVETAPQMQFLRAHHCTQVQGYLLGQPLPADQVEAVFGQPLGPGVTRQ